MNHIDQFFELYYVSSVKGVPISLDAVKNCGYFEYTGGLQERA
jgi:hypothetical protein